MYLILVLLFVVREMRSLVDHRLASFASGCSSLIFLVLFWLLLGEHVVVLDVIPTNGLVASYPFNGNANDESGNEKHGKFYGATLTSDRFGNLNRAYSFNGSAFISVPSSSYLELAGNTISVCLWFKPSTHGYSMALLSKMKTPYSGSNNGCIYLENANDCVNTTTPCFYCDVQGSSGYWKCSDCTPYLYPQNWYHGCFYWGNVSSSSLPDTHFYMKGSSGCWGTSAVFSIHTTSSSPILIGASSVSIYGSLFNFSGTLDDIVIYKRCLSFTEITSKFSDSIPSPSPSPSPTTSPSPFPTAPPTDGFVAFLSLQWQRQ